MRARIAAVAAIGLAAIGASHSRVHAQKPPPSAQEKAPSESRTVWDGVFTQKQADRGQPLYSKQCSECHGETLMGSDMTPPLVGGEFLSNWTDLTLGDLFERIHKTMPLNKPGSLTSDADADILAYILSVNKFPVGETELSHDTQVLRQIRIEATKPDQSGKGDKRDRSDKSQ
jgi:mono/diheme cytochrome c family protein